MVKKLLIGASTTVAAVVLAASPALAHFCSNGNWSDQAREQVLNSKNWFTFEDIAGQFLCPAGATFFVAEATEAGIPVDRPIHGHAVLGSGALFKKGNPPEGLLYLTEAQGEALDGIVAEAEELC